jgi:pilus assembly protein CpaC
MLTTTTIKRFFGACFLIAIVFLICNPYPSQAAGPPRMKMEGTAVETITLTMGKSLILESPDSIKRIALAYPAVADAMVLSPRQIYLTGKTPGMTSMTLWGVGDNAYRVFDLEVVPDANRLKEKLHTMLPGEKNISVTASSDHLTLSGTVSSAAAIAQVLELASAYAPGGKEKPRLINLLEVGGVHQVMLEVRVSEMSRSLGKRLGINFGFVSASANQFGFSLLDRLTSIGSLPSGSTGVSDSVNGILRFLGGGATWTVFIDALKENGLLTILAEPTLLTLSGKEARFLAGGEFPYPVPQTGTGGSTTITIDYKTYGVGLSFTPIVLSNGKISMQVAPEVSELDYANAVALQGYTVPGLSTRRVSTTVELADGQSFAIAGLLKNNYRENIRKFPLLGDIPVLGPLFRSSNFQKQETELIIIVTPRLVKPLDIAKQTLPTDQYVEPNDFEFYLMGAMEGKGQPKSSGSSTQSAGQAGEKLEGKFGHITPQQ